MKKPIYSTLLSITLAMLILFPTTSSAVGANNDPQIEIEITGGHGVTFNVTNSGTCAITNISSHVSFIKKILFFYTIISPRGYTKEVLNPGESYGTTPKFSGLGKYYFKVEVFAQHDIITTKTVKGFMIGSYAIILN